MIKQNLNDINKAIYDIFVQHDIKEYEMLTVYENCYRDFEQNYRVVIEIENKYFNILRDIIWYNIEKAEEEKTLINWGSIFPKFMTLCDINDEILYEDIQDLLEELNKIKHIINEQETFSVSLVGNEELFDDLTTNIGFIDKRNERRFQNDKISSKIIICYVYEDIRSYKMDVIKLNSLIDILIEGLKKAEQQQMKVDVIFI